MSGPARRGLGAAVLAVLVGVAALILAVLNWPGRDTPPPTSTATTLATCPLGPLRCPDPAITPSQVEPNAKTAADVCAPDAPGRDPKRQLTRAEERAVRARYHLPAGVRVVEYDHLTAHWAGGMSTPLNVWPQTSRQDKAAKDALEDRLYLDVCKRHTRSLDQARAEMAQFWRYD